MADDNDINSQDQYGKTRLHNAAETGNLAECKQLLEARADVNIRDRNGFNAVYQLDIRLIVFEIVLRCIQ